MAFFVELAHTIPVILSITFCSIYIHIALSLWQELPIEEEKSTPVYITKELYK